MGLVCADIFTEPAVVEVAVAALHGLDVAAEFLIEVVGEHIFPAHPEKLGAPFVPPREGHDLGVGGKGGLPLGVPEAAALSSV